MPQNYCVNYDNTFGGVNLISFLCGGLYILMGVFTFAFIRINEKKAKLIIENTDKEGEDASVKSFIFPIFVKILYIQGISSIYMGVIVLFVPLSPNTKNSIIVSIIFASVWALQRGFIDGVSFLLLSKGCGTYSSIKAGIYSAIWMLITFTFYFFIFRNSTQNAFIYQIVIDIILLLFYGSTWLVPLKYLFRRPALITYSKYWFIFRVIVTTIHFISISNERYGICLYFLFRVVGFAVIQPVLSYHVMIQDSNWWQNGLFATTLLQIESSPSENNDISLIAAQTLASAVDRMGSLDNVKILNFAFLEISEKVLGAGSFSKVYPGLYQKKAVAVKRIYTEDLTTSVINKIATEARLLSAVKNPNVVEIYGMYSCMYVCTYELLVYFHIYK
jgi:hypothetical protein